MDRETRKEAIPSSKGDLMVALNGDKVGNLKRCGRWTKQNLLVRWILVTSIFKVSGEKKKGINN